MAGGPPAKAVRACLAVLCASVFERSLDAFIVRCVTEAPTSGRTAPLDIVRNLIEVLVVQPLTLVVNNRWVSFFHERAFAAPLDTLDAAAARAIDALVEERAALFARTLVVADTLVGDDSATLSDFCHDALLYELIDREQLLGAVLCTLYRLSTEHELAPTAGGLILAALTEHMDATLERSSLDVAAQRRHRATSDPDRAFASVASICRHFEVLVGGHE